MAISRRRKVDCVLDDIDIVQQLGFRHVGDAEEVQPVPEVEVHTARHLGRINIEDLQHIGHATNQAERDFERVLIVAKADDRVIVGAVANRNRSDWAPAFRRSFPAPPSR